MKDLYKKSLNLIDDFLIKIRVNLDIDKLIEIWRIFKNKFIQLFKDA